MTHQLYIFGKIATSDSTHSQLMLGIVFQMDKVYKREEGHCEEDDEADPTWAQEAAAVIRSDQ